MNWTGIPRKNRSPRDPFVDRLTSEAIRIRLDEMFRQLSRIEEEFEQQGKSKFDVALADADISKSVFRDLPAKFKKRLQKSVEFSCAHVSAQSSRPLLSSNVIYSAVAGPGRNLASTYRDVLANYLQRYPHLQSRVSSITDYTPGKWLLEQEMKSRGSRNDPVAANPGELSNRWSETEGDVYDYAAGESMLGLCFSGGGVRSATFNLGILQALAELDLLRHFDYLSSVSGGGYIHEWFAAWTKRSSNLEHVRKQLIPQPQAGSMPEAPEPIRWLRRYASYLTPRRGLFSADLWVIVAVWFRNTLLNQIVLFTILGMLFAAPHFLVGGFELGSKPDHRQATAAWLPAIHEYVLSWCSHSRLPWLANAIHILLSFVFTAADWLRALLIYVSGLLHQLLPFLFRSLTWFYIGNTVATAAFLAVSLLIARNFRGMQSNTGTEDEPRLLTNAQVEIRLVVPLLAASIWLAFWVQSTPGKQHAWATWIALAILFSFLNAVLAFSGGFLNCVRDRISSVGANIAARRKIKLFVAGFLISIAAIASAVAATLLVPLTNNGAVWALAHAPLIPAQAGEVIKQIRPWRLHVVLLPPLYLSAPYFGIILLSGFLGADYPEACREWLARFRAWNLLWAGLWTLMIGAALLGPFIGSWLLHKTPRTAILGFLGAHIITLVSGSSGKSDGKPSPQSFFGLKPIDLLAWIASPIAIFGILVASSSAVEKIGLVLQRTLSGHIYQPAPYVVATSVIIFGCLLVQATLGLRIDVNVFSMHAFYRNRLARCYMGATNPNRRPDPFTGFDNNGELAAAASGLHPTEKSRRPIYVRNLLPKGWLPLDGYIPTYRENDRPYDGPFPIFCSTINLTFGQDLAWQERKGASFIFTPLFSGYHVGWTAARAKEDLRFNGYTPTYNYTGERGIALDTAAAISGAAMNPNQGYNTIPSVAFLMTLFNVRLGWWIWNPRHTQRDRTWPLFPWVKITRPSPVCAMSSLVKELMSSVDDTSRFVLLTDGGHFENMGLYELVRRRCKFIVVCDAEEDEEMQFGGIGRAIRNCRIDFGVEIDLDLRPLQLQKESSLSQTHCVVGNIYYPLPSPAMNAGHAESEAVKNARAEAYTGIIVYIKTSLTGDEPGDLLNYKDSNSAFPQDSTANQFFTESQFESYRRLGHHIGLATLQPAMTGQIYTHASMNVLFENLLQIWYPPTPELQAHFSEHTAQAERLLSELRNQPQLSGLAEGLFSQLGSISKHWTAATPADHAYALQFGNSLIDFMWVVYNNLQLAFIDNRTSPHAIGWIALFKKWCGTDLVEQAWDDFGETYPREFQLFARSTLNLP